MIGWLSGTLREIHEGKAIVEASGVGYEVLLPASALSNLGTIGSKVEFYIHTHVREDGISLFGFLSSADKALFLLLITVSGVGAKTALSILSALPSSELIAAIRGGQVAKLKATPGIGKKTAERLIVELKDKLESLGPVHASAILAQRPLAAASSSDDLISALVNLGYRQSEAETAVARVDLSKFESFDRMLKETLKVLTR